jgi:hypothetical protein
LFGVFSIERFFVAVVVWFIFGFEWLLEVLCFCRKLYTMAFMWILTVCLGMQFVYSAKFSCRLSSATIFDVVVPDGLSYYWFSSCDRQGWFVD